MKTIIASASPAYTSSASVALRGERATPLTDPDLAQKLLDNDAYFRTRLYRADFSSENLGSDSTWSISGSTTIVGSRRIRITPSEDLEFQLQNTGANPGGGDELEIRTLASAYTVTVQDASGSTLLAMTGDLWAKFVYAGSQWILWSKATL